MLVKNLLSQLNLFGMVQNTDATNSLPKRNVKLTTNGTLTEIEGTVGLTSQFSVTTGGIYYVNGTVDNEIL